MNYLHFVPRIQESLYYLIENDPVFSKRDMDIDSFDFPYYGPGFASLVRIVLGQQVSTHAAKALWQKFEDELPCVTPNIILITSNEEMRELGVSHQKAGYIRKLAEKVKAKEFEPNLLERMSSEDVYEAITALHGFGEWSAEMYLMFAMARPDIWPAGDLGIRTGMKEYLGLCERPDEKEVRETGARFAPHRTAAALLLWRLKDGKKVK